MNIIKSKKKINFIKILYIIFIVLVLSLQKNYVYADEVTKTITSSEPTLYSEADILIDAKTGNILYENDAYEKLYPASTTKLMTAILTLENCQLTDTVTVERSALNGIPASYTIAALQAGETLTVEQLLNVLLIPSANDAANVLACHIAGSVDNFSVMMNEKAAEIGCKNTHFLNPSGIHNDEHYSTAYDMALIGKYAYQFEEIKQIVTKTKYSLPDLPNGTARNFKATNTLINSSSEYYYEYATGLKTGYTDKAKSCIVATAKKDDIELICVVLGGGKTETGKCQRELDCINLFEYGFNNYEYCEICTQNEMLDKSNITNLPDTLQNTNLVYEDSLNLLTNINNYNSIKTNISWNSNLELPIYKNNVVGTITYTIDNVDYKVNLLAANDILPEKSGFISKLFYILIGFLILIFIITLFNKKGKKSSKEPKYFRHSFY